MADKILVDKIGYIADIVDRYRCDHASLDRKVIRLIKIILEIILLIITIAKWKLSYYYEKLSDKQKQLIFNVVTILSGIILCYSYLSLNSYYTNFTPNPNHFLKYLLGLLITVTNKAIRKLEELYTKLGDSDVKLIKTEKYSVKITGKKVIERYRTFTFSNVGLLNHKEALRSIYNNLMNNVDFTSFGEHKVLIITAIIGDIEYNFHPNIYLSNNTSFEEYYDNVKSFIDKHYTSVSSHIYLNDIIPMFSVKVWDMDNMKNANIKRTVVSRPVFKRHYSTANSIDPRIKNKKELNDINDGLISPYEIKNPHSIKPFGTMDVETMNINNKQVPIAISMCFSMPFDPNCKTEPKTRFFIINRKLLKVDVHKAVLDLFTRYFKYVAQLPPHTIFVHNLGSFDGYFILKYLTFAFNADRVLSIVDDSNKFIQISLCLKDPNEKLKSDESIPYTYWKDSYRIFPVSLNDLAKVFNKGEGKTSPYNPEFNSISMFNNKKLLSGFRKYSIQDSVALYKSMRSAIHAYHLEYSIDLSDVLSTSSLSLKIFSRPGRLISLIVISQY